jgi:L-ascorbate metabolism protein UlaG (beta-lactamase superfamily)
MISINNFLDLDSNGVFYTGHASIIVRINKKNFLFDYVKDGMPYGDRWRFFPSLVENIPMEKIDGVFISHIHQDHFDPLFLSGIDQSTPIYVIEGRNSFEDALNRYNIKHINIPVRKKIELAEGIYIYGLHHQSNGIDASCCIGNSNFSVYHGNDNYLNNELLSAIDPEFSNIDVACIPYAYINWYPQLLENLSDEEKSIESERLCKFYYEYAIAQANQLNAKLVIPFGANLVYKDSARSALNMECKTPLEFEAYVRETRGQVESLRFKALFSGDSIVKQAGNLVVNSADLYDVQSYRQKMQEYLETISQNQSVCETEEKIHVSSMLPLIKIKTPTPYEHFVCVCTDGLENGIMINTKTSEVKKFDLQYLMLNKKDHHIFKIKNSKFYFQWLSGGISIEEIIGSREFLITRWPNIYNKEILFIYNNQL